MTQLLILSCIVIVVLSGLLGWTTYVHSRERLAWSDERRFLTNRAIAGHVGEIVALDREETRRSQTEHPERAPRPLLEGLS